MIKLWHGSATSNIGTFRPGVHLGSEIQALMIIVASEVLDGRTGTPTLYSCDLHAEPEEICTLPDWRTPYIQGALYAYMQLHGETERFSRQFLSELNKLERSESEALSLRWLVEEMTPRGHVALKYPNRVEYKPDESYSVIDVGRLKLVHQTCPIEAEIRDKLLNVAKSDTGYDEAEWGKILKRLGRTI